MLQCDLLSAFILKLRGAFNKASDTMSEHCNLLAVIQPGRNLLLLVFPMTVTTVLQSLRNRHVRPVR